MDDKRDDLSGKRILFLGSSITEGSAAGGRSFVEFLAERDGILAVKEAVGGTTLTDLGSESYVSRLKRNVDTHSGFDLLLCQLSTNDAAMGLPLGTISSREDPASIDASTITGAIESIVGYARKTFGCKVAFFTNPRYPNAAYAAMVDRLGQLSLRYRFAVIDLWNDPQVLVSKREGDMADDVHPTLAGYGDWLYPFFRDGIFRILAERTDAEMSRVRA
jgi:lysophospholipase L1-like esterase